MSSNEQDVELGNLLAPPDSLSEYMEHLNSAVGDPLFTIAASEIVGRDFHAPHTTLQ